MNWLEVLSTQLDAPTLNQLYLQYLEKSRDVDAIEDPEDLTPPEVSIYIMCRDDPRTAFLTLLHAIEDTYHFSLWMQLQTARPMQGKWNAFAADVELFFHKKKVTSKKYVGLTDALLNHPDGYTGRYGVVQFVEAFERVLIARLFDGWHLATALDLYRVERCIRFSVQENVCPP